MKPQEFIQLLSEKIDNIKDFPVLKSLAIAQACLESRYGKSHFYNNLFGIKCHDPSAYAGCRLGKTKEFVNGSYGDYRLAFQTYNSFGESLADYARLMNISRYKPVREAENYLEATEQVRLCGYATSPTYVTSLRKIIEQYKLYELDYGEEMKSTEYLTPNFQYNEFFSGDVRKGARSIEPPSKYFADIQRMADDLQIVRDYIGSPIIITSAYRTPDWNRRVGGVKNSYHTQGIAVDVRVNGMAPYDLAVYITKLTEFNGYGINIKSNFVHVDYRDKFMVFKY